MKLAIPLYGRRVCPRFSYTQQIMIVELDIDQILGRKTFRVKRNFSDQIPEVLYRKGVRLVISGGMNHHFQDLFRSRGIEVIWGIIGEAEDAVAAFMAGKLTPGMGNCSRRCKRRGFRGRSYLP